MKIAVLGSGPAGMLAAHACKSHGHNVSVFSRDKKPSLVTGAQYVHEQIPELVSGEPDGVITYHKIGSASGYAKKVYGDELAPTSWDIFPVGEYPCWGMRKLYGKLWESWSKRIQERDVTKDWLDHHVEAFDLIVSTIPAYYICRNADHKFPAAQVWFEKASLADKNLGDNFVYYSGDPTDLWYRASWIFGQGWFEYGDHPSPNRDFISSRSLIRGIKPLDTDCDCRPRIIRAGRFGEWKKGKLVHHAYYKTIDALEVVNAL